MSQVWFTADTHFGHANIVKYCGRPFLNADEQSHAAEDPRGGWRVRVSAATVERHDTALLQAINESVMPNDTLWILGDFCLGKHEAAARYRNRIVCRNVNLVWGNHDDRFVGSCFSKTIEQGMIRVQGQKIWLNHYPMRSWDGRFRGSWHLYGHVHGRFGALDWEDQTLLTRDVGVDACDYRPISFNELRAYMAPRITAFEKAKAAFVAGDASVNVD